jgi:hypothetical protein
MCRTWPRFSGIEPCGLRGQTTVHGHANVAGIREGLSGSILVNPTELAEGFQMTPVGVETAQAQRPGRWPTASRQDLPPEWSCDSMQVQWHSACARSPIG